jgi:hypothetical protein
MNAQKLSFKLFLRDPAQAHGLKLVPVFQSWIQTHAVEDHLAIDVADYEHVPDGPGTVLVTHEANFSLDSTAGRPGLLYQRKQPLPGEFADRIATTLRHTLQAAARLEQHPGLKFRTDELSFRIADRLLAPNTAETFAAVRPALASLFPGATLEHKPSPLTLFEISIKPANPTSLSDLLAKLPAPAAV